MHGSVTAKKLRFGFIGCGGIANEKHLTAMAVQPEAELAAFCDLSRERAEAAASKFGAPGAAVYTDYRQLLANRTIDAVHVLTPNATHCEIACAAMEAGKHVICEKPMAASLADAERMMATARRTGRLFTVSYQYRHFDANRAMKDYVDSGALGEIYYAEANAIRRRGVPTWGVFTDKAAQGGGPLIDIATHALDLTLWMMNNYEVASVTGVCFDKLGRHAAPGEMGNPFGPWDPAKYTVEDAAFGFVRMKNGALINIRSAWAINMVPPKSSVVLCGTRGGLDSENGVRANHVIANRQVLSTIETRPMNAPSLPHNPQPTAGEAEAQVWVNALLGRGELLVKPEQAFVVSQILDAVYRSAQSGRTIYFD